MRSRERMLLALAIVTSSAAAWRVAQSANLEHGTVPSAFPLSRAPGFVTDDSLEEAAGATVVNDPFRLVNRPSDVRFESRSEGGGVGAPPPPPPLRPTMQVRAIMGGPPWMAIVDGIPGQPAGVIVRSGSMFEKITVRTVGRDTVVVQAPDTTWKLTLMRDRP